MASLLNSIKYLRKTQYQSCTNSFRNHRSILWNHHFPNAKTEKENTRKKRKWKTILSSLGIQRGLVPGAPMDTKIHRCSSRIVSPLYLQCCICGFSKPWIMQYYPYLIEEKKKKTKKPPIPNIRIDGEGLNAFLLGSGIRQEYPPSTSIHCSRGPSQHNRTKEKK